MEESSENPQLPFQANDDSIPILLCEPDGIPILINSAAQHLISALEVDSINKLLPKNHVELVRVCYKNEKECFAELRLKDQVIRWSYSPNLDQETVYLYGENFTNTKTESVEICGELEKRPLRNNTISKAISKSIVKNEESHSVKAKSSRTNNSLGNSAEALQNKLALAAKELEVLRKNEARYRALYEDNPAIFFTVDVTRKIVSANQFGAQQLGYSVNELLGKPWSMLIDRAQQSSTLEYLDAVFRHTNVVHRWKTSLLCKQPNHPIWVGVSARASEDRHGQPAALIVCEDITEAHYLHEQLTHQASHDALTGLANRREFERRLHLVLKTAWENQAEHALCYVDLDQFKIINDTNGHIAGDALLVQLSRLLQKQIRKSDLLARLGGDEFGILMEHCTTEEARRVANDLRSTIEQFKFVWEGQNFSIAASIGLVPINESCESITGILSAADAACYEAKDAGRNRVHEYNEKDTVMMRRHGEMQLVIKIDRALQNNRFRLYFQSIIPIDSKKLEGEHYELLIRLKDEEGAIAEPSTFLPTAERYRLSDKLDRWVINKAFNWFTEYPEIVDRLSLCSINLSGHSMADERFHEYVIDQFDKTGIMPHKICFEITETAAIANLDSATRMISFLQELGCRFALDDFGSGLSSFGYLKNIPVDYLKIDGQFVKDMLENPMNLEMVKSINGIAQLMGKKTIAEFVESKDILEALRTLGVNFAQGYYIGKPQPIEKLIGDELLEKYSVKF